MNFPIEHKFTKHHHSQSTIIDYGHLTKLQSAIRDRFGMTSNKLREETSHLQCRNSSTLQQGPPQKILQ